MNGAGVSQIARRWTGPGGGPCAGLGAGRRRIPWKPPCQPQCGRPRPASSWSWAEPLRRLGDSPSSKWVPIPLSVGLLVLGAIQYRRVSRREQALAGAAPADEDHPDIRIQGPWQVHVISTLPLRSLSRLWGWLNSLTLPVPLRAPIYGAYARVFGCNLAEMQDPDLSAYKNLSEFFYREIRPQVRPVDHAADLVVPADGRVLSLGKITGRRITNVKGKSYGIDALLGRDQSPSSGPSPGQVPGPGSPARVSSEEDFAEINYVNYSLDRMLGEEGDQVRHGPGSEPGVPGAPVPPPAPSHPELAAAAPDPPHPSLIHSHGGKVLPHHHDLYYAVVYLAPGDYHRFHSPTEWTVLTRRHFSGELFSVSPYMVGLLENLFVLNERVVLLGEWRYGLMSYVPVGATNVGSIKVNFDEDLWTNVKTDDHLPLNHYTERSFRESTPHSPYPHGHPLVRGEEMGGFQLGSTVVMVFEAPKDFSFDVAEGAIVKMGQSLGRVSRLEPLS